MAAVERVAVAADSVGYSVAGDTATTERSDSAESQRQCLLGPLD